MKLIFALPVIAALTACGPLTQNNPTMGIVRGVVDGSSGEDEATDPGLASILSRDFIEAQPNDIMLASVIAREATAVLIKAGTNGSKVTWISPDGISLTFDTGVLVASRGLGDDLMGANVAGVVSSFENATSYMRTHDYMNGLNQIETETFACSQSKDRTESLTIYDRTYETDVFVETCEDGNDGFINTFWRSRDGVIWQARQWVSDDVGYVGYQRLSTP